MPTDSELARDLYRQVLELRDLLEAVARELELLASDEPRSDEASPLAPRHADSGAATRALVQPSPHTQPHQPAGEEDRGPITLDVTSAPRRYRLAGP